MPCHVPATRVSPRRRPPSPPRHPPTIAARLDLSNPGERAAHDLVGRFVSGRRPLWRPLDMRREGRTLYVAVEWSRYRKPGPYSVVAVSLDELALSWRYAPSATAARRALDRIDVEGPSKAAR